MKLLKSMPLEEAKRFYEELKKERERIRKEGKDTWIVRELMENIYFFTNEFTQDY